MMKTMTAVLCLLGASMVYAMDEAHTASVISPWEGQGTVFMSDPKTAKLMGVFKGVMFVQRGEKEQIDTLPFVCPSVQVINLDKKTGVTTGDCQIGAGDDIIFAAYECAGPIGGCEGSFKLRGGTGKFSKISGGSKLSSRTETGTLLMDAASGIAVKTVKGVLVLPELTYKIPSE